LFSVLLRSLLLWSVPTTSQTSVAYSSYIEYTKFSLEIYQIYLQQKT